MQLTLVSNSQPEITYGLDTTPVPPTIPFIPTMRPALLSILMGEWVVYKEKGCWIGRLVAEGKAFFRLWSVKGSVFIGTVLPTGSNVN